MRAIATITLYVYGDNEKELISSARKLESKIEKLNASARLEGLTNSPFGSVDPMEHSEIELD